MRAGGTILGLTAILQLLDLLDQAGQIVTHGGIGAVGHYVFLRTPSLLAGALPLGVLAGAMLCFARLSTGSEMIALRAAGISLGQVVRLLLPACTLLSVLFGLLSAEIGPHCARALSNWWERTAPSGRIARHEPTWMHFGSELIAVTDVSPDGLSLKRVVIVHRSAAGDLIDRIDAPSAHYSDRQWQLKDATVTRVEGGVPTSEESRSWPDAPSPANIIDVLRPIPTLPVEHLVGIMRGRWASAHGAVSARTSLESLIVGLLDPLVRVVLAAPLLLAPPRSGGNGLQILRTIALGLGFMGSAGLLAALGASGTLPSLLVTSLPTILFGGLGWIAVMQADAGK